MTAEVSFSRSKLVEARQLFVEALCRIWLHGAHLLVEQVRHLADLFELPDRVRLRGADLHIGVKGKHDDDNKGDGQGNDAEKTDEIALE